MALQKRVLNWVLKPFRKKAPVPEKPAEKTGIWKKASDIKKINVGTTLLGQGAFGKVYAGSIQFKDGSRHRVAIKRFVNPLSEDKAMKYRQGINDLIKAGVRLLKMDLVKLPSGEWVQVSQLFGSIKRGSKIEKTFYDPLKKLEAKIDAVKELTKVANAGYYVPFDLLGVFKGKVEGISPYDIDMLVKFGKVDSLNRAGQLTGAIRLMTPNEPAQRKALLNVALNTASPKMKKALLEYSE